MCLFDRQMVLLDQLKQCVVKMFGSWFVIHRGGVVYIFVYIRGLKLAAPEPNHRWPAWPSMTGWRIEVVIVRRRLKDEGVEDVIVLRCIIHQQALCTKCF